MLNFPSPSRFFDPTRRAVRFWGHDSAMEWSFFVTENALKRLQPNVERSEASLLLAFYTHRAAIHAVAITTYKRERKGSYELVAADFFFAGLRRTELRELLVGSVFPNHSYALEYQRDRGALLLILFRLWLFLLAIASQLALCHLVLPSLAVDAAFSLPARHRCTCRAV